MICLLSFLDSLVFILITLILLYLSNITRNFHEQIMKLQSYVINIKHSQSNMCQRWQFEARFKFDFGGQIHISDSYVKTNGII